MVAYQETLRTRLDRARKERDGLQSVLDAPYSPDGPKRTSQTHRRMARQIEWWNERIAALSSGRAG